MIEFLLGFTHERNELCKAGLFRKQLHWDIFTDCETSKVTAEERHSSLPFLLNRNLLQIQIKVVIPLKQNFIEFWAILTQIQNFIGKSTIVYLEVALHGTRHSHNLLIFLLNLGD